MIVDNFEQIRKHLVFDRENDPDWFYQIQVLIRRKDEGTTIKKNCHVVRTYYIRSVQNFDDRIDQIKKMCELFHARAYIRLNPSSWKKCVLMAFGELATYLRSDQCSSFRKIVDEMAGKYVADGAQKTWIVDIDAKNSDFIEEVIDTVNACMPNAGQNKIIDMIPTKNGVHLITTPFNVQEFRKTYKESELDIHKNNPTLLYFNDEI